MSENTEVVANTNEKLNPTRKAQAKKEAKEKAKAEKVKKAAEPKFKEVQTYKLVAGLKIEDYKGQRQEVVKAMREYGKAGTPEEIAAAGEAAKLFTTDQPTVPVVRYHIKKLVEDKLAVEAGVKKVEVVARKRSKKSEEPAA